MDPQTQAPPKITLLIEFDPNTQELNVNGPLQNRMLCYGLLKLAEKAVDENFANNAKPRIQPALGINGDRFRR